MKGTEQFKETIQKYLNDRAGKDELFAETLKKPNKNIDSCIDYIFNTVQKSGKNGFTDAEVYNMAVHYYDEDSIVPVKSKGARVIVNHAVEGDKQKVVPVAKKVAPEPTKKPAAAKSVKKQDQLQATISFD